MDGQEIRELVALGKDQFHRGDYAAAASIFEQVIARGAAYADVHHLLGLIYHQMGEFESALRSLERALEINPNYVEAALNLAILCNDVGQYERAQQYYAQATEGARAGAKDSLGDEPLDSFSKGKISNLHAAVGDGYMSCRRPLDAAVEYRRALTLCPSFADLRLKLAGALRDAGQRDAALGELRRAVHDAPNLLAARVALGVAFSTAGKIDEAMAQWHEVLRRDPDHRTAQLYVKLSEKEARGPAARGTR
jgi:tetratricopeptide (TPR) repeat protein